MSSQKGYFSAWVESVCKDVEGVFSILKKQWKILDSGMCFHDIKVVENFFVVCWILHNNMLTEADSTESDVRFGWGVPLPGDGIWLHGDDQSFGMEVDRVLSTLWGKPRNQLAEHAHNLLRSQGVFYNVNSWLNVNITIRSLHNQILNDITRSNQQFKKLLISSLAI